MNVFPVPKQYSLDTNDPLTPSYFLPLDDKEICEHLLLKFTLVPPPLHPLQLHLTPDSFHMSLWNSAKVVLSLCVCIRLRKPLAPLTAVYSSSTAMSEHYGPGVTSLRMIVDHLLCHYAFQVTNGISSARPAAGQNYAVFPVSLFKIIVNKFTFKNLRHYQTVHLKFDQMYSVAVLKLHLRCRWVKMGFNFLKCVMCLFARMVWQTGSKQNDEPCH